MYSFTKHFQNDSVPRLKNKFGVKLTQEFARQLRNFNKLPQTILFRNKYKMKDMVLAKVDNHYLVFCINPETKVLITVFTLECYMETVADEENKYRRNLQIADDFTKVMEKN